MTMQTKGHDMSSAISIRLPEALAKELDQIAEETERDHYMSAEEAKQYGLIDEVLHEEEKKPSEEKKENK